MNRRDLLKAFVALPAISAIAVVDIQPADVIVVECDELVSEAYIAHIKAQLGAIWPNHKIVVFDKGYRMRLARNTVTA